MTRLRYVLSVVGEALLLILAVWALIVAASLIVSPS
jgi:hypothetical protein